jgi:hypothetical protein
MDTATPTQSPHPSEVHEERRKLKWFLGFILVVLIITATTDVIFSFYHTPKIPKERNPFVTTEAKTTPTPFFTPIPTTSMSPLLKPSASPIPSNTTACTMDARECPDGTFVGRSGPNCEFVACPK